MYIVCEGERVGERKRQSQKTDRGKERQKDRERERERKRGGGESYPDRITEIFLHEVFNSL